MKYDDPDWVAAAWSNLAEPGDTWAGALRRSLGDAEALRWAAESPGGFPEGVPGPAGQTGAGAAAGWRAAHRRWQPRFEDLNVERDLVQLEQMGGRLVTPGDSEWPTQLNDLEDRAPAALWVRGGVLLSSREDPAVSIVGARAASAYGMRVASEIAFDLAEAGLTVVSGGAYGIDAAAHRGSLDAAADRRARSAENGLSSGGYPPTVAVICGGLGSLYPPGNESLFRRILAEGGAIVAEVPPRFRPARWRFLERNRLIAAWSDITVVPEAGLRSGALATANRAVELGRDVAAVPGPVTSSASAGPHSLIKEGAALVESARDVIEIMVGVGAAGDSDEGERVSLASRNPYAPTSQVDGKLATLDPVARRVYEALPAASSTSVDRVVRAAGLSAEEVGGALLSLNLANLAHREGEKWARAS